MRRSVRWRRQSSSAAQLTGSRGDREWPVGQVQRSPRCVGIADGQAADLGVGCSVQQCEQAGEPFVRMGRVVGPSPEQRTLDGGVQDVAGEGRLAAQPQGNGRVDEDEFAAFRPAEEAAQDVGSLVKAAAGAVAEECFEVGGGHLGPAGHRPGGCQVDGQVAEDPEPGLQGDVADRVPGRRAGLVPALGAGCR